MTVVNLGVPFEAVLNDLQDAETFDLSTFEAPADESGRKVKILNKRLNSDSLSRDQYYKL